MPILEVTFGSTDRSPLVRNEAELRACLRLLAGAFGRTDGPGLVAFGLRGDRLRTMVNGAAPDIGRARGPLLRRLRNLVRPSLSAPEGRELGHRAHVMSVLRHYVAPRDEERYEGPAALASGSCLPDLVGARAIRGMRLVTAGVLPRLRIRQLLDMVGLPVVAPADDVLIHRLGASRLVSAAAFAAGVGGVGPAMDDDVLAARRVVVRIGADAGIAPQDVARATGVTLRSVRRLAAAPADGRLERAVRLRLAIEETVCRDLLGPSMAWQ